MMVSWTDLYIQGVQMEEIKIQEYIVQKCEWTVTERIDKPVKNKLGK